MKLLTALLIFCIHLLLFLSTTAISPVTLAAGSPTTTTPATFRAIFASCNKHDRDQSYWHNLVPKAIGDEFTRAKSQDYLDTIVWLGDIVYQDAMHIPLWPTFTRVNETEMRHRWTHFKNAQGYQYALKNVKKGNPILGIYDDHDMGKNDEGKECETKELSQQLLLDFLDVPKSIDDPEARVRRTQRKGVYHFKRFPLNNAKITESNNNQMNVCFVMLDGRSNRDKPRADGKGDMLGEVQWKWLEQVLKTGRDPDLEKPDPNIKSIDDACVVTFIGSGTLVIADSAPMEGFGEFPESRDRLLRMLRKSGASRFVIISGDVHYTEINVLRANKLPRKKLPSSGELEPQQAYHVCGESPFEEVDLYEVTSSGTTHHLHPLLDDKDRFESWFPSHRRLPNGIYTKENAGYIQINCPIPDDIRSCNVGLGVVALPDAKAEVQRIDLNFALDSAMVVREKSRLGAAEVAICHTVNDPEIYHLPTYFAPWTTSIMWWKQNVPGFEEEGRLIVMFSQIWTGLIAAAIILVLMWKCCCCRPRIRQREEENKNEKRKEKEE